MKNRNVKHSKSGNDKCGEHLPAATQCAGESAPPPTSEHQNGGQTSIGPPSKVKIGFLEDVCCLASGIDTLYLSLNVLWLNSQFLQQLSSAKQIAKDKDRPEPILIADSLFQVLSYGRRGYAWILENKEFTIRIGDWEEPKDTKPSVLVELRSEVLWRLGPENAVDRVLTLLKVASNSDLAVPTIRDVKVSRVDLCADMLTPGDFWKSTILDYIVTRARNIRPYLLNGPIIEFTGVRIGSGHVLARLYDKPLEIKTKGDKEWMYDIWELDCVPESWNVVRVEFQLLRKTITDLGINTPDDLFRFSPNLWAYCTQHWLKLQSRPGTHHSQKETLPWWGSVQSAYEGAQDAHPLIRCKAINQKQKQLIQQAYGLMTSLTALQQEQQGLDIAEAADFNDCLSSLFESFGLMGGSRGFAVRVFEKRAKNHRAYDKLAFVKQLREELGFADSEEVDNNEEE